VADFEASISNDPACATAYFGLGIVYHDLGNGQAVIENLQKVLELTPTEDENIASAREILEFLIEE
jgi:lipoprotein NlpI